MDKDKDINISIGEEHFKDFEIVKKQSSVINNKVSNMNSNDNDNTKDATKEVVTENDTANHNNDIEYLEDNSISYNVLLNESTKHSSKNKYDEEFSKPEYYFNKELSWVDFNERVLEQALNKNIPLLERFNFLCIFSSNFDEFFMIRVAGLKEQVFFNLVETGADNMLPKKQLKAISEKAHTLVEQQYKCYREDILPKLEENGIFIKKVSELDNTEKEYIKEYWDNTIFPIITPLAVDPAHPFPRLINSNLNVIVELNAPESDKKHIYFAFVPIPKIINRLVMLPFESKDTITYVLLEDIIENNINALFPGLEVLRLSLLRVTRNSDIDIVEEEADDLLKAIQREVRRRERGNAVRLEVSKKTPSDFVMNEIKDNLNIEEADIYYIDGPLDFKDFFEIHKLENFPNLKYKTFIPYDPIAVQTKAQDFYSIIKERDVLLYHPYDSFQSVVDFISNAADDPQVLAIKQTLYRTAKNSPFVKALVRAAEKGKQVTALVEIKARFDEESNINYAKTLEQAGVNVVYGLVGLKTHCKMALVVRREDNKIRKYVHLSTGNYNYKTAKLYGDIGFFTSKKSFSSDVLLLFNVITGYANLPPLKKIIASPINMKESLEQMVLREKSNKEAGKKARIIIKCNSLSDQNLIKSLYDASQSGVKIDLFIRGICCIRPGVKGISENIRVFSIIDRFLEHARIFYFYNDGNKDIYLSSADWRPRNLERRIETMFPIEEDDIKNRLINEIHLSQKKYKGHCYEMDSKGKYHLITDDPDEISYQQTMIEIAEKRKSREHILLQGVSSDLIKKKKRKRKKR